MRVRCSSRVCSFSAGVAGVDNSVAHDGDACAIWVLLFGTELADYFGKGNAFASVAWGIFGADGAEGVGTFGVLSSSCWSFAYALA